VTAELVPSQDSPPVPRAEPERGDGSASEAHDAPAGVRRWFDRRSVQHIGVFALYLAVSLLLFGPKVVHDFSGRFIAGTPEDAAIFMWALRWWPYALGHHLNPLYTKLVWAPSGINLAWTTTPPVPSLFLTPITLRFGPIAAYNVMALLGPAASAWAAYLLCRRVTHDLPASIAGGFFFGFSTALLAQLFMGHPNFFLAFMVPLAAYWVVRYLEGSIPGRAFVVLLAMTVLIQFGISIEVTATMTLFAAVAWVVGWLFAARPWRARLARAAALGALAYVLAGIAAIPWLYVAFTYPRPVLTVQSETSIWTFARRWTALAGAVRPGYRILGGAVWPVRTSFPGTLLYLGVPLLFVLVHLLITQWRRPAVPALAVTFVLVFACAFGSGVVFGRHIVPTPFRLLQSLPLLKLVIPDRLLIYCGLIAGVGVAVWLSLGRRAWWRWALVALAIVTALPNLAAGPPVSSPPPAAFFQAGLYRRSFAPGEPVLMVTGQGRAGAFGKGNPMIWQAESGMRFALAGGWLGAVKPGAVTTRLIDEVVWDSFRRDDKERIDALLSALGVRSVVAVGQPPEAILRLCRALGAAPDPVGGVVLFRGPFSARAGAAAAACG